MPTARKRIWLARLAMVLGLLAMSLSIYFALPSRPALADDGGYPWSGATLLPSGDWGYATCPSNDANCKVKKEKYNGVTYGVIDPYRYYLRYCTSFVAWKLAMVNGWTHSGSIGNASNWKAWAQNNGYTVDQKPAIGSVAWFTYDHVAWVSNLNSNGTVQIEEYNNPAGSGAYNTRPISKTSAWYIHFKDIPSNPTPTPTSLQHNLLSNGDFAQGSNHWISGGPGVTNFAIYQNSYGGIAAYSGQYFGATNTSQGGGSMYQDVSTTINGGDMFCASVMLASYGASSTGTFVLWINSVAASIKYAVGKAWTSYETCLTATSSANGMRFQLYPDPGSPSVAFDDSEIHESVLPNGDFIQGSNHWISGGPGVTNFAIYQNSYGRVTAYSGQYFGATNTSQGGGSMYQDVSTTINNGDMFCASVMLASYGASSTGSVVLWINGMGSTVRYAVGSTWMSYKVCNTASASASSMRFQLYPDAGSPSVAFDDSEIHKSVLSNGDFLQGSNHWIAGGPGVTNFAIYQNSYGGIIAYSGQYFGATNTSQGGGSMYQDVSITINSGDMFCASIMLASFGASSTGNFVLWINGVAASIRYAVGNTWTPHEACLTANGSVSGMRFQLYPDPGSPSVAFDNAQVY